MLTEAELAREAAETRFQKDPLEKAIRLLELLESLRSHPFLKPRIALKGGTALNLFVFDVPRLSVDIDLNYVGASDLETMLSNRPKVEQALEAVGREVAPFVHARVRPSGRARARCELHAAHATLAARGYRLSSAGLVQCDAGRCQCSTCTNLPLASLQRSSAETPAGISSTHASYCIAVASIDHACGSASLSTVGSTGGTGELHRSMTSDRIRARSTGSFCRCSAAV